MTWFGPDRYSTSRAAGHGRLGSGRGPNPRLAGRVAAAAATQTSGELEFPQPAPFQLTTDDIPTPPNLQPGDVVFLVSWDRTPVFLAPWGTGPSTLRTGSASFSLGVAYRPGLLIGNPADQEVGWAQANEAWPFRLGTPMRVTSDYNRPSGTGLQHYVLLVLAADHGFADPLGGIEAEVLGSVVPSFNFAGDPAGFPDDYRFLVAFTDTGPANHLDGGTYQGWFVEAATDHIVVLSAPIADTLTLTLPAEGGADLARFVWAIPLAARVRGIMRGRSSGQHPAFDPAKPNPLA